MITLRTENLHGIPSPHGIQKQEMTDSNFQIPDLLHQISSRNVGFHDIELLKSHLPKIQKLADQQEGKFQNIVILGIGGSALGPICIKHAFSNPFLQNPPNLHIVDNIDPRLIYDLEKSIQLKTTLFVVITKSGTTPETISQYLYFKERIKNANLAPQNHFIFITDPTKGYLREITNSEKIPALEIPPNIGGRFSVLTAVGLFPAALLKINIQEMLDGASEAQKSFTSTDPTQNIPFQIALIQYLLYKKGKTINVMMPYLNRLERFSAWYGQLLAESIGKKFDNHGNIVHSGITPVNALGATDQHSQTQLYNEGPNDKLIMFLTCEDYGHTLEIPRLDPPLPSLEYLKHTSFNELIQLEQKGTELAYTQNHRPNITIQIDKLSPHTLGELFMTMESATAFLGEMLNINTYDQPGVELSKELTKTFLLKK
ncbi:glucose-6-phosphate isomerase [Candidatus Peregrinibacteria bacterium HGW-Peregrinibacteria-1]|jgi:glucose-6-phosphate isomerase|nr:MAG: glucose-6-phosphate isomerase [Candidatus Peregrinibacteria bacterium HGW-Peregrinibacteria-1]